MLPKKYKKMLIAIDKMNDKRLKKHQSWSDKDYFKVAKISLKFQEAINANDFEISDIQTFTQETNFSGYRFVDLLSFFSLAENKNLPKILNTIRNIYILVFYVDPPCLIKNFLRSYDLIKSSQNYGYDYNSVQSIKKIHDEIISELGVKLIPHLIWNLEYRLYAENIFSPYDIENLLNKIDYGNKTEIIKTVDLVFNEILQQYHSGLKDKKSKDTVAEDHERIKLLVGVSEKIDYKLNLSDWPEIAAERIAHDKELLEEQKLLKEKVEEEIEQERLKAKKEREAREEKEAIEKQQSILKEQQKKHEKEIINNWKACSSVYELIKGGWVSVVNNKATILKSFDKFREFQEVSVYKLEDLFTPKKYTDKEIDDLMNESWNQFG